MGTCTTVVYTTGVLVVVTFTGRTEGVGVSGPKTVDLTVIVERVVVVGSVTLLNKGVRVTFRVTLWVTF